MTATPGQALRSGLVGRDGMPPKQRTGIDPVDAETEFGAATKCIGFVRFARIRVTRGGRGGLAMARRHFAKLRLAGPPSSRPSSLRGRRSAPRQMARPRRPATIVFPSFGRVSRLRKLVRPKCTSSPDLSWRRRNFDPPRMRQSQRYGIMRDRCPNRRCHHPILTGCAVDERSTPCRSPRNGTVTNVVVPGAIRPRVMTRWSP